MTDLELHEATYQDYLDIIFPEQDHNEKMVFACQMAIEAHALPQVSKVHSFAVAKILAKLNLDENTLIATLISDPTLEPYYSAEQIKERFGVAITKLVEGIRTLNHFKEFHPATTTDEVQTERLRQMLLAMTSDIRIMIVKLAYRVARLRTLKYDDEAVRRQIAEETQLIFAPLANRLGISQLKWEMEDLSFRFLRPDTYKQIAKQLASKRTEREDYIQTMLNILEDMFAGRGFHISGRPKHIYSIWKKMSRKELNLDELFDLRAVRIYVDTIQQCYEVLGQIHSRWSYVKDEFDDYIASPKENGYQSIHTVIIGPLNQTVEIQVRTHEMHYHAEYGVAAHWKYKEGNQELDESLEKSISMVRQMLEYNDNPDLLNELSTELLSEHIYVMTPTKEIISLRKGYTPLDFAYHIHTELGHRCRGAKINGRIVPLTYQLQTGDEVEILSVKGGKPSRNWLNPNLGYLNSSRSRTKVRSWFNHQNKEANIEAGEAIYHKEVRRLHAQHIGLKKILQRLQFELPASFFEALGKGNLNERQVTRALQKELDLTHSIKTHAPNKPAPNSDITTQNAETHQAYVIGSPQLKTTLAPCCTPKPEDEIIGYVTRGRGITVHKLTCANILNLSHEESKRLIPVAWCGTDEEPEAQCYLAELEVLAFDRKGLLRDIMSCLIELDINLTASNTQTDATDRTVQMRLELELPQHMDLGVFLDTIEHIQNVETASLKKL